MQRFSDLKVWQRSQALGVRIYRLTEAFRDNDLRTQLRRAAVSAPANIAEGSKRAHPREYAQFLNHAAASLAEVDSHVRLASEVGLLAEEATREISEEVDQISRMLTALRRRVLTSGRSS